jgi:hypothetical protein
VKRKGASTIYNEIPRVKNVILKMQIHRMHLDEEVRNFDFNGELY